MKGIGGSSIQALGVGRIKLLISKRAHILLEDVLFIPNASVRLISIGSLCRSHKFVAHFDNTRCWLMKKNGTTVASSSLGDSCALYSLDKSVQWYLLFGLT